MANNYLCIMKLREVSKSKFPTTEQWLANYNIENYTIRPNGIVDVNGDVNIQHREIISIPIQFGYVKGNFLCLITELNSLKGAPYMIGGHFNCYDTNITSLEYAPKVVKGDFKCHSTKMKSLSGIQNHITEIGGMFVCDKRLTHILGLILIENLARVCIDADGPIDRIMNRYVKTGDILSAQDELLDAGFKSRARL